MAITADAGARALLSRLVADPEFQRIERLPRFSAVHVGLTAGVWLTFIGSSVGYLLGWLPLPITILLNAVATYAAFTTLHDATHRSVSSDPLINDLLGTLSGALLLPGVTTSVYRVLHLEHHRWVGDCERDPDTPLVHTRWPWLPLALAFPEFVWAHWWVTKLWLRRSPKERFAYFATLAVYVGINILFLLSPYAWYFVGLWLIPQKLGIMLTVYSFAHIQHPEGVDWRKAPLQATAVIKTRPRRLVDLLMMGQNDHHIHHLLPHIPWHRYRDVWNLADGALRRESLAERGFISGFDEHTVAAAKVKLQAQVQVVRDVAEGVRGIVFEPEPGTHFPRFEAGAHVDVYLPSGLVRQYSLCNDPSELDRYEIAVKLAPNGQGGSLEVHEVLRPGTKLTLGTPRNLFRLHPETRAAVLVSGGIGVTPLLSMSHVLHQRATPFELHVCARTQEQIPFDSELDKLPFNRRVHRYIDRNEQPALNDLPLGQYQEGQHLYLCGPSGFMQAVLTRAKSRGWPKRAIHTESFGASQSRRNENRPFVVELRRSQKQLSVGADSTIVDELRRAKVNVPTACLQGVCGSCRTRVLEGEVEHRDAVLSEGQRRNNYACVCVSRAKGERLVLDA